MTTIDYDTSTAADCPHCNVPPRIERDYPWPYAIGCHECLDYDGDSEGYTYCGDGPAPTHGETIAEAIAAWNEAVEQWEVP